jgi:predicted nucleic acid-binding protein
VLDTNVLSELLRARPEPAVVSWLRAQPADGLFVTTVTQAEMRLGARLLPEGKRRRAPEAALAEMFEQDFVQRVLSFGPSAVPEYVEVVALRRAAGRPVSQFDAQIAAIARGHRSQLATRNLGDFAGCGLTLVDPWRAATR